MSIGRPGASTCSSPAAASPPSARAIVRSHAITIAHRFMSLPFRFRLKGSLEELVQGSDGAVEVLLVDHAVIATVDPHVGHVPGARGLELGPELIDGGDRD